MVSGDKIIFILYGVTIYEILTRFHKYRKTRHLFRVNFDLSFLLPPLQTIKMNYYNPKRVNNNPPDIIVYYYKIHSKNKNSYCLL